MPSKETWAAFNANLEKDLAELKKPVDLGEASGDWIAAREAKLLVKSISQVSDDVAI